MPQSQINRIIRRTNTQQMGARQCLAVCIRALRNGGTPNHTIIQKIALAHGTYDNN